MRLVRFVRAVWRYSSLYRFFDYGFTGSARPSFKTLWRASFRPRRHVYVSRRTPVVVDPGSGLERAVALLYAGHSLADVRGMISRA